MNVLVDPALSDRARLDALYGGALVVRQPSSASRIFIDHARTMIEEAFDGYDPRTAQHHLEVEEFAARFAPLKTSFIHSPRSRACIQAMLAEMDCDPDDTYIDVPRLRVATSDRYLVSGPAYAHHPHRDTWYSAPMAQINWWMPIYDYEPCAGMVFHPHYFARGVRNGSSRFDYYRWNGEGRAQASQHIRTDTREQPKAEEPLELQPEVNVVLRAGACVLFSAQQLHTTCANVSGQSRYSIDFRTVRLSDVLASRGAANVDASPTGTSLRDFVRLRDLAPMPEEAARALDARGETSGPTVFVPAEVTA